MIPNGIGRVGSALLGELEELAFRSAEALACDASLNVAGFYLAHGYVEQGLVDHVLTSGASVACVRMRKPRPAAQGTEPPVIRP